MGILVYSHYTSTCVLIIKNKIYCDDFEFLKNHTYSYTYYNYLGLQKEKEKARLGMRLTSYDIWFLRD